MTQSKRLDVQTHNGYGHYVREVPLKPGTRIRITCPGSSMHGWVGCVASIRVPRHVCPHYIVRFNDGSFAYILDEHIEDLTESVA